MNIGREGIVPFYEVVLMPFAAVPPLDGDPSSLQKKVLCYHPDEE